MSSDKLAQALRNSQTAIRQFRNQGAPCALWDEIERDNLDALAAHASEQAQAAEPVAWIIWTHGPVLVFLNVDEARLEFDRLKQQYPEPARRLLPLYTSPQAPEQDKEDAELPPMPEPVDELAMEDGFNVIGVAPVFTAEQMRAYARAARAKKEPNAE